MTMVVTVLKGIETVMMIISVTMLMSNKMPRVHISEGDKGMNEKIKRHATKCLNHNRFPDDNRPIFLR